jgi:Domain of unknown function (DUF5673)
MAGGLGILIFTLVFVLGISYISTAATMGHEAAQRTTQLILVILLFSVTLGFLVNSSGKYGFVVIQILFVATIIVWLLSWSFRKQKAGILLLDIGKNEEFWVVQVGIGLAYAAFAGYKTWSFFRQVSKGDLQYASFVTKVSDLAFWSSLAICVILQGLSKTEFRHKGICAYFRFISWQKIKSYNWEESKPNILTIRYKHRFPLFPNWTSWPIPVRYREDVSRILDERLQDKSR